MRLTNILNHNEELNDFVKIYFSKLKINFFEIFLFAIPTILSSHSLTGANDNNTEHGVSIDRLYLDKLQVNSKGFLYISNFSFLINIKEYREGEKYEEKRLHILIVEVLPLSS